MEGADAVKGAMVKGRTGRRTTEAFRATADGEDDDPAFMSRYIHLRGATILSGTARGNLQRWRGRLPDVTGWSFCRPA